jgi:hypothetical protein
LGSTQRFASPQLSEKVQSQKSIENIFRNINSYTYSTLPVSQILQHNPCAAKAIFYCPSMNSHRPRSQNTAKERTLNPEKDSTRKRPRSHVSLEKSSKNYKPLENLAKPNLLPDITPQPANFFGD